MLYECNVPRLLIYKYGPLVFGLVILFGLIPKVLADVQDISSELLIALTFPLIISGLLIAIFFNVKDKLKYVAISKMKVIIKRHGQEIEYSWLDVERIELNRFWGLYYLKLKNEDEFYFTPYGLTTWLTGDNSEMGAIIDKMKKELQI
jgi:hypothetical protein